MQPKAATHLKCQVRYLVLAFLLRRRHVLVTLLAVRHHRLRVVRKILCDVDATQHIVQVNVNHLDFTLQTTLAKCLLELYTHHSLPVVRN